jgi:parallel beta-helix repeat protein
MFIKNCCRKACIIIPFLFAISVNAVSTQVNTGFEISGGITEFKTLSYFLGTMSPAVLRCPPGEVCNDSEEEAAKVLISHLLTKKGGQWLWSNLLTKELISIALDLILAGCDDLLKFGLKTAVSAIINNIKDNLNKGETFKTFELGWKDIAVYPIYLPYKNRDGPYGGPDGEAYLIFYCPHSISIKEIKEQVKSGGGPFSIYVPPVDLDKKLRQLPDDGWVRPFRLVIAGTVYEMGEVSRYEIYGDTLIGPYVYFLSTSGVEPVAYIVTVRPGESIQAAIDQAPAGAVICLAEGEWRENITIEKALTLRGQGAERTVIRGKKRGYSVVEIRSSEGVQVTIEKLTVTEAVEGYGVLVDGNAQATITQCTVFGNEWCGIGVGGSARATIQGSIVSGNRWSGISLWGRATIQGSTVSRNGRSGIVLEGSSAQATIQENRIFANQGHGVALYERPCYAIDWVFTGYVTGKANLIYDNLRGAVCPDELSFLMTTAGGELNRTAKVSTKAPQPSEAPLKDCTILLQPGDSIQEAIRKAPEKAIICLAPGTWRENIIIDRELARQKVSLTLRGSGADKTVIEAGRSDRPVIIIEGPGKGELMEQHDIQVSIENLTITGARLYFDYPALDATDKLRPSGIWIGPYASVTVQNCVISKNDWHGIVVSVGKAVIQRCHIFENKGVGILVSDGSEKTVIEDNTISKNEWGIVIGRCSEIVVRKNKILDNVQCGFLMAGLVSELWSVSSAREGSYGTVYGNAFAGPKVISGGNVVQRNGEETCPAEWLDTLTAELSPPTISSAPTTSQEGPTELPKLGVLEWIIIIIILIAILSGALGG